MKVLNTTCPNCHASLQMDIDKLMAYCPYCRTELAIDLDVDNYISEKEQTKREEEATKREQVKIDLARIALNKNIIEFIFGILILILFVILMNFA